MGLLKRSRWFAAGAGITLAFAGVSLSAHPSFGLTAFADIFGLAIMLATVTVLVTNAAKGPREERSFWTLLALGYSLWVLNQTAWCYFEIFRRQTLPDPFSFDIVLFFHAVPLIAAVAWRPDIRKKDGKVLLGLLNFAMLMGWWVFLYAFVVFPYQYVHLNVKQYNAYYDALYLLEHGLLIAVLGLAAWTSSSGWRRLYLHLLGAMVSYAVGSQLLDRAILAHRYYSGSLYDILFILPLVWVGVACISAREWVLETEVSRLDRRWKKLVPRLAMLTILSLPILGLWTLFFDSSESSYRIFRLYAVLAAMLLLGAFVFLRQYIQDQKLMRLLLESRISYDEQKRLQDQLVQKEKLASLGHLISGAAQEIDHPLDAIMNYSEELWSQQKLSSEQDALVRKIVQQARRTRDLVANLLSFAQQAPGDKTSVNLPALLSRAVQLLESRRQSGKVMVRLNVESGLPPVLGNAKQLFQAFVEIIENAMDALDDAGGGALEISALHQAGEILLLFSDNGPGVRDPQRVFDPFYTTKPVGKGTGLGLSAVYGMVQDHGGSITCENKAEGGALFSIRLPITTALVAKGAGASV